jgi:isopenicillin N synthase-like dioxygenase
VGVHANSTATIPKHLEAKVVSPSEAFQTLPIIDLRKDEQAFFNLPADRKLAIKTNDDSPVRGYFGRGAENLDGVVFGDAEDRVEKSKTLNGMPASPKKRAAKKTDNKEGLDMNGVPWAKPGESNVARVFGKPSQWPEDLPEMRETVERMSAELFKLAKKLLRLMALALGRGSDFFEALLSNPVATHRILHYWPLLGDFERQIGIGEHTDYGLLTILRQDDVGGLQVLSGLDMQWVMVPPINGAYVVNLGDIMSIWTCDYFKSTIHRVVNIANRDRFSSPYFLEPNLDTLIKKGDLEPRRPDRTAEEILEEFYCAAGLLKPESPNKRRRVGSPA